MQVYQQFKLRVSHLHLINTPLVRFSSAARKKRKGGHPGLSMQEPERKERGKKKRGKGRGDELRGASGEEWRGGGKEGERTKKEMEKKETHPIPKKPGERSMNLRDT